MSDLETYKPIDDLAEALSIKPQTLRAWVRQGLIPRGTYIKAANTYRFNIPKVLAALSSDEPVVEKEPKWEAALGITEIDPTKEPLSLEQALDLDLDENEDF